MWPIIDWNQFVLQILFSSLYLKTGESCTYLDLIIDAYVDFKMCIDTLAQ